MNSREQKKIQKRNRILDAAIQVIAKNGFHGTTISQIAKVADVADGTIYLYFENKDDILVRIFEEVMDQFISQGKEVLDGIQGIEEKLLAIAECHLGNLGENESLACVFQVELRHSIHIMKKFSQTKLREYFSLIQQVVEEGQKQGVLRSDLNSWTTVKVLFGALDEMATNWILRQKDYALKAMAKPTIEIFLNGMRS